jgi:hypothetical protein
MYIKKENKNKPKTKTKTKNPPEKNQKHKVRNKPIVRV